MIKVKLMMVPAIVIEHGQEDEGRTTYIKSCNVGAVHQIFEDPYDDTPSHEHVSEEVLQEALVQAFMDGCCTINNESRVKILARFNRLRRQELPLDEDRYETNKKGDLT